VVGFAARGEADAVALLMLRDLLVPSGVDLEIGAPGRLSAEVVQHVRERDVRVVVVASMPPGGLSQARYLCKRLRAGVPDVRIVVGRWAASEDADEIRAALIGAGADSVATRLLELRDGVLEVARTEPSATPRRAA
jgi:methylmalonyl-CoA mutase cobalamin-binding subunit